MSTGQRWSERKLSSATDTLSTSISNLRPATTYNYRTFIQAVDCDTVFSEVSTFVTDTVKALQPVVLNRTQHTAIIKGEVVAGDAVIYTRGMQFRSGDSGAWEDIEDAGDSYAYTVEKNNLGVNALYQARTYVQPAGCDIIYSDVLSFRTKDIELFVDSIRNVYQRSATIYARILPGDDQMTDRKLMILQLNSNKVDTVQQIPLTTTNEQFSYQVKGLQPQQQYAFSVEAKNSNGAKVSSDSANEALEDYGNTANSAFKKALLAAGMDASKFIVTYDNTWYAGNGYVYMSTNSDGKNVTLTFTLTAPSTVSFIWGVRGTSGTNKSRIYFYVDGVSKETLTATSNSSTYSKTTTLSLAAGKHTLIWSSYYYGTYYATISNVMVGNVLPSALITTTSYFSNDVPTMTNLTQTSAKMQIGVNPTNESGLRYGFRNGDSNVAGTLSNGNVSGSISGLLPRQNYACYAYVDAGDSIYRSGTYNYTTLPVGLNVTMSNVTQTSAKATVNVDAGSANIKNLEYRIGSSSSYKTVSSPISITGLLPDTYYYINFRYNVDGQTYTYDYGFRTLSTTVTISTSNVLQTSCLVSLSASVGTATYKGSGIEVSGLSEPIVVGDGDQVRVTELTPNASYTIIPYVVTEEGGKVYGSSRTVHTQSIDLETMAATNISNRSATMNGTIDCDDYSSAEFGFQWKEKAGWTTDPRFTKGRKNEDGSISLGLVNGMLKPDTEYEYRTAVRYKNNIYYASQWKDFRTELEFIIYPATPYTMYRTDSENNRLVLCGYYVAGSEDVVSQGYEYWKNGLNARQASQGATDNRQVIVTDSTMASFIDLNSLDDGNYSLRAFVTTSSNTYYGQTLAFSVGNYTGILDVHSETPICLSNNHHIVVRNAMGQHVSVFDLGGRTVYSGICDQTELRIPVSPNVYIVRVGTGYRTKMMVK